MLKSRQSDMSSQVKTRLSHHGSTTFFVDCRNLMDIENGMIYVPVFSSIGAKQYYKFPLSGDHELKAIARLIATHDNGNGSIKLKYRRKVASKLDLGVVGKAGWEGARVRGCLCLDFSDKTSGDIRFGILEDAHVKLRLKRKLTNNLQSVASVKLGNKPKALLGIRNNDERGNNHTTSFGATTDTLSLNWHGTVKIDNRNAVIGQFSLANSALPSTTFLQWFKKGLFSLSVSLERTISQLTKAHLGFSVSPLGLFVNVGFTRLGQTFQFPLLMSSVFSLIPTASTFIIPVALYFGISKFILDPRRMKSLKYRAEKKNNETTESILLQKKRAETFIELMEEEVHRKQEAEDRNGGLVIIQAFYGKINIDEAFVEESTENIIDVTIPLQFLVKDSKLELPAGSKSTLIGFYDPCPGEEKYLQIHYLLNQQMNEIRISDASPLSIPVK